MYPKSLQLLIKELSKLPTIGEKSASRLAYHIINNDPKLSASLSRAMIDAVEKIKQCSCCFHLTENEELCSICSDDTRDSTVLCIVEKPIDLIAIESSNEYLGRYHVLHGLFAPLRGMRATDLKLVELAQRVSEGSFKEVIIATNSTLEGDATALYISNILEKYELKVTRLAQGMPKGGELEYVDGITLSKALSGRVDIES